MPVKLPSIFISASSITVIGIYFHLSPVAVVFAVLAGAQLAGFLGMLIALPVAAVIVVLLRHVRENYEKSQLYAAPPVSVQQASAGEISIQHPKLVLIFCYLFFLEKQ